MVEGLIGVCILIHTLSALLILYNIVIYYQGVYNKKRGMKSFKMYDEAINWIKFLSGSDLRIKILLSLEDGAKDLNFLKERVGATSSTILHSISGMEDRRLIVKGKGGDGYSLTNLGKIQVLLLVDLIKAFDTLHTHKDFWLNHEMIGIPESLIKKIGYLSDSTVVRSTSTDLLKPFSNYAELLSDAKDVKGVFSVFYQDFVKIGENLIDKGINFWMVLTREVFDILLSEHRQLLDKILPKDNFKMWVIDEEVKESFTITDSAISFSLFLKNDVFDVTSQLVSRSDEAILWGLELFEYYRKKSKEVKIEDI